MSEGFEINRPHKIMEWLENQINEWAYEYVADFYGVEDVTELTEEQIVEVEEFCEENEDGYDLLVVGLRNCVHTWESENDA